MRVYEKSTQRLISHPQELKDIDVSIIGSGPSGAALAHRIQEHERADLRIAVIECGDVKALQHVNNLLPNSARRSLIDYFGHRPWEGDLEGGWLVSGLGGRGIVAGAHLRRMDAVDFTLWKEGKWPPPVIEALTNELYDSAERDRRVSTPRLRGSAQAEIAERLKAEGAYPPPIGVDLSPTVGFSISAGYDSSAATLWRELLVDCAKHHSTGSPRRFFLSTETYAVRVLVRGSSAVGIVAYDPEGREVVLPSRIVVLAASPIESARLALNSGLNNGLGAVGSWLAEHTERRAKIRVECAGGAGDGVSLVLPPPDKHLDQRYQIHLRGEPDPASDRHLVIDIGGFAAVDPRPENRVTLSGTAVDRFGVPKAHTRFSLSENDKRRAAALEARIREVAAMIGGTFITRQFPSEGINPQYSGNDEAIQMMPLGRSYHEAGTLRMGTDLQTSVTDHVGKIHGIDNVYVSDASLFPSVGIANPMLTITALAYRVGDAIVHALSGHRDCDTDRPWSSRECA